MPHCAWSGSRSRESVRSIEVAADEGELGLDRWFKRHFPGLTHGRLEKLLRTGQVRVDGRRAKASLRLAAGQVVRVPPIEAEAETAPVRAPARQIDEHEARDIQARVLYRDGDVIVIDKPAGLSVQGGPGIQRHLDGLLDALQFDSKERPRLVHRLDRDTSGVLALARDARAAAWLAEQFRLRTARKLYWAVTVGVPNPRAGEIDVPLEKRPGRHGERMLPYYRYLVIWSGLYTVHGGVTDWGNDTLGILSFSNELWNGGQYFNSPDLKEQQKDPQSPIAPRVANYFFNDTSSSAIS